MAERHALLIESNPALARTYSGYLRDTAWRVTAVGTVADAVALLRERRPSVIVLDLRTPDMAGFEAIAAIQGVAAGTPLIAIASEGSVGVAVDVMRRGAQDFLVKPFSETRFCAALDDAFAANETESAAAPLSAVAGPDGHGESRRSVAGSDGAETDGAGINGAGLDGASFEGAGVNGFLGASPAMQAVFTSIRRAAPSKASVFILGESGTGKELVAEAVHRLSDRASGPFIALNCAAIPTELIESEVFGHVRGAFSGAIEDRIGAAKAAEGGTLFLDELCEMPLALQSKLLRFVQSGSFTPVGRSHPEHANVRFVCATNRDPLTEIAEGRFRQDLYYRLHVLPIRLPPLRQRGEDVVLLATHFLTRYAQEEGKAFRALTDDAAERIRHAPWPGNVRQLQNTIRRAVVGHDGAALDAWMLPAEMEATADPVSAISAGGGARHDGGNDGADPDSRDLKGLAERIRPLAEVEREAIEEAVRLCAGDVRKAAVLLEISPATIYRKQKSWASDTAA